MQGVNPTDVLNVRAKPDFRSAINGELTPDSTGISLIGPPKRAKGSRWRQVACGKVRGWVNERFLAPEKH